MSNFYEYYEEDKAISKEMGDMFIKEDEWASLSVDIESTNCFDEFDVKKVFESLPIKIRTIGLDNGFTDTRFRNAVIKYLLYGSKKDIKKSTKKGAAKGHQKHAKELARLNSLIIKHQLNVEQKNQKIKKLNDFINLMISENKITRNDIVLYLKK